ncbi:hypothetical protein AAG570_010666 [Ranatra chinensis]|uniref:V-type proton ATPase subunit a n=1 Tax=Ranatra chinensis TaxID=642074 RepID=A0ABD0YN79_9HEMI
MFHGDMEGRPDDKFVNQQVDKISFIVCCQGEELTKKVKKVCEGYRAPTYMCPTKISDIRKSLIEVSHTINDLYKILTETEAHKNAVLKEGAKYIRNWLIEIRKMKGIFHTMNYFDIQQNETFVAHCWIPYSDIGDVYNTLYYNSVIDEINRDVKPVITEIDPLDNPPTYFKLNKFTKAFQKIIEAYGIASYREINPTLFTIITFPFLFGVMFGDMGHATIMTLFATVLIIKEKKYLHTVIENEIFKMLFGGRYVILLMGIFSFYIGFIYNDIFSISMNIFGTTWRVNYDKSTLKENELLQLNPSSDDFLGKPPPFGLDPMWKHSVNDIDRTNVLKMKVSIIIGVLQMFFGICLSLVNHIYFKNYLSIYCEFIPQVIFFLSLFGYLVALIFIKWVTFGPKFDIASSPHCAPSILITFIGMILMKKMEIPEGCERDMYAGQGTYQKILVGLAVACVPWMLIMKPVILIRRLKNKNKHQNLIFQTKKVEGTESEEPSEIFIHQCIHTIEFVLGSVSYTASYLRLWALSLAHGQLAEVLWSRVMKAGFTRFEILGGVFVYIAFACWAGLTVSIMVVMEGLSAFLHALRLHW